MRHLPYLRVFQMRLTEEGRLIDYAALDALAQRLMAGRKAHLMREKGFIYRHGKRVMAGVIDLRRRITDDGSHDDALKIAGLFHDVGKGIEPHARSGAALVRELLKDLLAPTLLHEVAVLVQEHTNHRTDNPFARILQDADALDHFGTIEIGLSFQYGAYNEEGIDAALSWYQREYLPYTARVRERIKYEEALAIYDEKVAFTRQFIERFLIEAAGRYA